MKSIITQDRIAGAIMGAFIGDAMALGPHWYYDLDELHRAYGTWIDDYTTPKPGRYHQGLKAGELSQSGIILKLTLQSLLDRRGYDQDDFCTRIDKQLLAHMDGKPMSGPGGYTSQSIRTIWKQRMTQKLAWSEVGSHADTAEAIERTLAIALFYAFDPHQLSLMVAKNSALTQVDELIGAMSVAYGLVLSLLVQGHPFDRHISDKLFRLSDDKKLPFHKLANAQVSPPLR